MNKVIINEKDNVGVCLDGNEQIPAGHKYALRDIAKDTYVIKYGEIIGRATQDIQAGEWVHTHNVKSHLDESVEYSYNFQAAVPQKSKATFLGYKRAWGRAGIRNDIYIIPTVGCVNNVCIRMANEAQKYLSGSIDGVYALTHQFGCSQLGEDTISTISSILQSRAVQILTRTSLETTAPSLPILVMVAMLMPAFSASSFFFISRSIKSLNNFL